MPKNFVIFIKQESYNINKYCDSDIKRKNNGM